MRIDIWLETGRFTENNLEQELISSNDWDCLPVIGQTIYIVDKAKPVKYIVIRIEWMMTVIGLRSSSLNTLIDKHGTTVQVFVAKSKRQDG